MTHFMASLSNMSWLSHFCSAKSLGHCYYYLPSYLSLHFLPKSRRGMHCLSPRPLPQEIPRPTTSSCWSWRCGRGRFACVVCCCFWRQRAGDLRRPRRGARSLSLFPMPSDCWLSDRLGDTGTGQIARGGSSRDGNEYCVLVTSQLTISQA